MELRAESQIEAIEEVIVLAGAYPPACRVGSFGHFTMQDHAAPAIRSDFFCSNWYVGDVGMVLQVSSDEDGSFTMRLLGLAQGTTAGNPHAVT